MKKYLICLLPAACCLLPVPAFSAGTYYTGGGYQSPQVRYSNTGASPTAYNPGAYTYNPYGQYQRPTTAQVPYAAVGGQNNYSGNAASAPRPSAKGPNQTTGFYLGGGITHEFANWEFSLKTAGSKLGFDNLAWNVLDLNGGYAFGNAAFGLKIDAGFKYGMQSGESRMVDDDITAGGYLITTYVDSTTGATIGNVYGHALSVGTSSGGNMLGFNAGLGLTDKLAIGKIKLTPSVGYRMLSYTLTVNQNYGMSLDTGYCITVPGSDEVQCDPFVVIQNPGGTPQVIWGPPYSTTGGIVDTGGTYYYQQPGTSHKYDVSWSGPYLAMDAEYPINENNAMSGRVELGLPSYTSAGDQPYRPDWKHPKSVEDSASLGSAYHLGLAALWSTALTNSVSLQMGLTYDYYTVSGANAKTFLNGKSFGLNSINGAGWPNGTLYDQILNDIANGNYMGYTAAQAAEIATSIQDLKASCPGWVCATNSEVNSIYSSMGIRLGIMGKF
ncbi:MAG: hypothetical protein FWC61_03965 [Proteobacteria bacterium]|nr:hypothetical protein [Pseudomonadota bacterium]